VPGILTWAVEGAVRYLDRGRLPEMPVRVRAATEALAESARLMGRFLDERGQIRNGADPILLRDVRRRFVDWLDAVSSSDVASLLRQEGFRVRKGTDNKTFVYGLALDAPTYAEF
jgi:hypothetical protein